MLFHMLPLDEQEADVCARVDELRLALRGQVSEQRRWTGLLRRVASARAIQGSNSIEGLNVSLDDAVAAVGGGEPLDAPEDVWAAIQGYREAMTFVLQLADDPHFQYDASLIRSLHYMMMQYDWACDRDVGGPGLSTFATNDRATSYTRGRTLSRFPGSWRSWSPSCASRIQPCRQSSAARWRISIWS